MVFMDRTERLKKMQCIFWSSVLAILFGVLCYIFFQFFSRQIGSPPAIAIMSYIFIAGEVLIVLVAIDKFEGIKKTFINPSTIIQDVLEVLLKKENRAIVMTLSIFIIASFLIPKLRKA
jgi:hypothetical protein